MTACTRPDERTMTGKETDNLETMSYATASLAPRLTGMALGHLEIPTNIMLGPQAGLSASPVSSEDDCHPASFCQQDGPCEAQPNNTGSLESYHLGHSFPTRVAAASITRSVSQLLLVPGSASSTQCTSAAVEQHPSLLALSPCCPSAMQRSVWCLGDYDLLTLLHTGDLAHVHKVGECIMGASSSLA